MPTPGSEGQAWSLSPVSKYIHEVRTRRRKQAPPRLCWESSRGTAWWAAELHRQMPHEGGSGMGRGARRRLACLRRRQNQEGASRRERFVSIPRAGEKLLEYLVFIVLFRGHKFKILNTFILGNSYFQIWKSIPVALSVDF